MSPSSRILVAEPKYSASSTLEMGKSAEVPVSPCCERAVLALAPCARPVARPLLCPLDGARDCYHHVGLASAQLLPTQYCSCCSDNRRGGTGEAGTDSVAPSSFLSSSCRFQATKGVQVGRQSHLDPLPSPCPWPAGSTPVSERNAYFQCPPAWQRGRWQAWFDNCRCPEPPGARCPRTPCILVPARLPFHSWTWDEP